VIFDAIVDSLIEHGIFAAMVVYFVWQSWRRETRLAKRIDQLQETQKKIQMDLIQKTIEALTENTVVMKFTGKVIDKNVKILGRVSDYLERAERREVS